MKATKPGLILAMLLLASGCGGPSEEVPPADDAGTLAGDAGVESDDVGIVEDDAGGADCVRPTSVREVSEPVEVRVDEWTYARGLTSAAYAALERGTFEQPSAGTSYEMQWQASAPGDNGALPLTGSGGMLAVTTLAVDEPTTYFVLADAVQQIWVDGRAIPGDPYGHRDKRVPLRLDAGENVIAVQYGYRNNPAVRLYETDDEIFFNFADVTIPDLRQGTTTAQPVGVSVLNLTDEALREVEATVVETSTFAETTVEYPGVGPAAVTQIGFDLEPTEEFGFKGATHGVRLRISSCELEHAYEAVLELGTVNADESFRRTFWSPIDSSVQYYGVVPPSDFDPDRDYALTLSLHGASVRASGQARAYSQRDWTYVIAPTNRRRFGFDWEEWGRLNGIAALDHATEQFNIDPTRVYVTGHSMGGHGTWQFGALFPGRFAAVGPSAGWESFYSYGGATRATGPIYRARASSDTLVYLSNLARRGGYIIHGDADNNVPVSEGRKMRDELLQHTDDVVYHEEPGAGHWWDGPVAEGADCVDWPDLFDFFGARTLDPYEVEFDFRTPGPAVSDRHSYVTVLSVDTPMEDAELVSRESNGVVELTTANVRAMRLDTGALAERGITGLVVDGEEIELASDEVTVGDPSGKNGIVSGPFNQVFHRPFCFAYGDSPGARDYVANLVSTWSIIGNGHACSLPVDAVTPSLLAQRNVVFVGVDFETLPTRSLPFDWSAEAFRIGERSFESAAALTLFTSEDRLHAAIYASEGSEHLLYRYSPFSSRAGMPDFFVWDANGGAAAGFFDQQWQFDPTATSFR